MEERPKSLMPPRKRDWKEGHSQVGIFIRDASGRVVEAVLPDAGPKTLEAAYAVLKLISEGETIG